MKSDDGGDVAVVVNAPAASHRVRLGKLVGGFAVFLPRRQLCGIQRHYDDGNHVERGPGLTMRHGSIAKGLTLGETCLPLG